MKVKANIGKTIMTFGVILLVAAIALTVYNLYDQKKAEKFSTQALECIEKITAETDVADIPLYKLKPDMEMPLRTIDGIDYIGTLYIEQFQLKLPIISDCDYGKLKKSPCRYYGTAYKDNMVIAAHNYRSHFASLKNISIGSKIVFTDIDANEFVYKVVATEVLQPEDVETMISSENDLTLFTCTAGGRTRITVRCERIQ